MPAIAQTEYERQAQNREYKRLQEATQRAYHVPSSTPSSSTYKSPSSTSSSPSSTSSSSSSSSSSGSRSSGGTIMPASGNVNIGGSDRVNRQEAAGKRNEQRAADRKLIVDRDVAKFKELLNASSIPKDPEHHNDLWLLAQSNNIDYSAIRMLIGADPEGYRIMLKSIVPPTQVEINASVKRANETESKRVDGSLRSQYEEDFKKAGFTPYESKMITLNHILSYSGELSPARADIKAMGPFLTSLTGNLNASSFDDFKSKIETLTIYGPYTALTLINKVKGRFTDKTAELEKMEINCIVSYFNIATVHNDHENSDKLIDVFLALLKKYPDVDVYVLANNKYNDPFQTKINNLNYYGAKSKQKDKIYKLWGDAKNKLDDKFNTICQTSAGIESAMAADKSLSLCHFISKKYKSQFGGIQDAVDFEKYMYKRLTESDNYYDVYMMKGEGINTYLRCSPQVLKELSEHGNFVAQYLYSLHLCTSNDEVLRKQQSAILLKRAENGDYNALALLCYAPLWETLFKDKIIRDTKGDKSLKEFADTLVVNYDHFNTMFAHLTSEIKESKIPAKNLYQLGLSLFNNMPSTIDIFRKYKQYAGTWVEKYKL